MAENKMKEVAKLLGVEMGVPFNVVVVSENTISHYSPHILKDNGLYDKRGDYCGITLSYLLNGDYEIERPILTQKEKAYLEAVVRPFKDKVKYISKKKCNLCEWICVEVVNDDYLSMPMFEKDTMYKGMELNKKYTLEELGLFE